MVVRLVSRRVYRSVYGAAPGSAVIKRVGFFLCARHKVNGTERYNSDGRAGGRAEGRAADRRERESSGEAARFFEGEKNPWMLQASPGLRGRDFLRRAVQGSRYDDVASEQG
ncbi:unnamed protein product [Calypogeia fissa]